MVCIRSMLWYPHKSSGEQKKKKLSDNILLTLLKITQHIYRVDTFIAAKICRYIEEGRCPTVICALCWLLLREQRVSCYLFSWDSVCSGGTWRLCNPMNQGCVCAWGRESRYVKVAFFFFCHRVLFFVLFSVVFDHKVITQWQGGQKNGGLAVTIARSFGVLFLIGWVQISKLWPFHLRLKKLHKSFAGVSCREGPWEELWSGQPAELIYAHLCHKK